MNLSTLEKRIRTLETMYYRQQLDKQSGCPAAPPLNYGTGSWLEELEELTQQARLIMEQANAAGDLRTALASIRVRCCIVELRAKLRGDFDEPSTTNILNLNFDSETLKRIAETYLARRRELESK